MKIENIKIYNKTEIVNGFTFKKGFISFESEGIKYAASGWRDEENLYLYSLKNGDWEKTLITLDDGDEEILAFIQMLEALEQNKELTEALEFAKGKKLHNSLEKIEFTDVVAGKKCNNGGEYGFSTIYEPIQNYPGIYRKKTTTTCDFDHCGTGYQGIVALTKKEYKRLLAKESQVLEEGNKYN